MFRKSELKIFLLAAQILAMLSSGAFAEFGDSFLLRPGSVGTVSIVKETHEMFELWIGFPAQALEKQDSDELAAYMNGLTVDYDGQFTLFDESGVVAEIPGKPVLEIGHWCENESGSSFRPGGSIEIKKNALKRPLKSAKISSFIYLNPAAEKVPLPALTGNFSKENIVLRGDLDADGRPEALLFANPCKGASSDKKQINLKTERFPPQEVECCGE